MKKIKKIVLLSLISVLFFNCKKEKDPPQPVVQQVAVSCPQGYTGANCQTQITPTKIVVHKIVVTKFPQFAPGGFNWDSSTGDYGDSRPDLYVDLLSGTTSLLNPTVFYQDANYFQSYTFDNSPDFPFDIYYPELNVSIKAMDFDVLTDDFLGGILFAPYYDTNGFPSVIYRSVSGVGFEIHVSYVW